MLRLLPKELISLILYELDYNTLILIYNIDNLDKYEKLDTILFKRRISCFPRIEGHSKLHNIPEYIITNNSSRTDNALSYLIETKADLVKGDLIFFCKEFTYELEEIEKSAIFNGKNFQLIENSFQPLTKFDVINSSIPFNYWENLHNYCNSTLITIETSIFCRYITNIKYGQIGKSFAIYVKFIHNNIEYIIIRDNYAYNVAKPDGALNNNEILFYTKSFKNELSKNRITFSIESDSIYESIPNALYYDIFSD